LTLTSHEPEGTDVLMIVAAATVLLLLGLIAIQQAA
jgi:hypothetical protein